MSCQRRRGNEITNGFDHDLRLLSVDVSSRYLNTRTVSGSVDDWLGMSCVPSTALTSISFPGTSSLLTFLAPSETPPGRLEPSHQSRLPFVVLFFSTSIAVNTKNSDNELNRYCAPVVTMSPMSFTLSSTPCIMLPTPCIIPSILS